MKSWYRVTFTAQMDDDQVCDIRQKVRELSSKCAELNVQEIETQSSTPQFGADDWDNPWQELIDAKYMKRRAAEAKKKAESKRKHGLFVINCKKKPAKATVGG